MWISLLAATADNLTLPSYGICGVVILGLSRYCWILDSRNQKLMADALANAKETAETTLPLLLQAIEGLKATAPHIERGADQVREEANLVGLAHRLDSLVSDLERREKHLGET